MDVEQLQAIRERLALYGGPIDHKFIPLDEHKWPRFCAQCGANEHVHCYREHVAANIYEQPIAIDLCCGKGGWARGLIAAGFHVIGFDIEESFRADYPGEFHCVDVLEFFNDHRPYPLNRIALVQMAALVVASPPCDGFSRHAMPWTRKRNPPPPDLSLVEACQLVGEVSGAPFILENVREAQRWIGKATWHFGPFYLWGDVPALMPKFDPSLFRNKETYGSKRKAERAMVPFELGLHIGRTFALEFA